MDCGPLAVDYYFFPKLEFPLQCTYIGVMKKLVLLFLFVCTCSWGFAKEPESKTFLVLFNAEELELLQTDMESIAAQLNPFFPTKIYEGKSWPYLSKSLRLPSMNAYLENTGLI